MPKYISPFSGQGWISELRGVHVQTEAAHAAPVGEPGQGSLHGGGGGHAVHDVRRDLHPPGARHVRHRLHSLAAIL